MRPSCRLLNAAARPVTHAKQASPLVYSLGLSYAAKMSPPFVAALSKPPTLGFSGKPSKLGKWVDSMKALPAGRGELRPTVGEQGDGGWDRDLQARVMKWGAGEDFFAVVDGGSYTHLAAADGVGGWAPKYDPSLYAQSIMYHYNQAISASPSSAPWDALTKAYEGVEKDDNVEAGSSTAVAVSLGDTGKGRAVNVGDSGFTILRGGQIAFESSVQTHFFNCPYQLAKLPHAMRTQDTILDTPAKADKYEFDLEPSDIVLLYTDGLSDNLPAAHIPLLNKAILQALATEENAYLTVQERAAEQARLLADVLVAAGRNAMLRTGEETGPNAWKTPFEIEAKKHNKRGFRGGKIDDITVLVAVVSERLG